MALTRPDALWVSPVLRRKHTVSALARQRDAGRRTDSADPLRRAPVNPAVAVQGAMKHRLPAPRRPERNGDVLREHQAGVGVYFTDYGLCRTVDGEGLAR